MDDTAPWPFALCSSLPAAEGGCPPGFMSHYFAPLSSCSVADAGAALASLPPLAEAAAPDQDARVVLVQDDSVRHMYRSVPIYTNDRLLFELYPICVGLA